VNCIVQYNLASLCLTSWHCCPPPGRVSHSRGQTWCKGHLGRAHWKRDQGNKATRSVLFAFHCTVSHGHSPAAARRDSLILVDIAGQRRTASTFTNNLNHDEGHLIQHRLCSFSLCFHLCNLNRPLAFSQDFRPILSNSFPLQPTQGQPSASFGPATQQLPDSSDLYDARRSQKNARTFILAGRDGKDSSSLRQGGLL
jgi:hypothetical protein